LSLIDEGLQAQELLLSFNSIEFLKAQRVILALEKSGNAFINNGQDDSLSVVR